MARKMSLEIQYDPDNIFSKIIRNDIPAVKIAETDNTLAFMDVFPQSRGHCLVIPKNVQATNLFDISENALCDLIVETQRISRAVKNGLEPDGVRIAQFNGAPAGQTIFHIHFHIIPVYTGEMLGAHAIGVQADNDELQAIATKIISAL